MTQHTPEPWEVRRYFDGRREVISVNETVIMPNIPLALEADLDRIVACVNACAGTTTDDLNRIADAGGWDKVSESWSEELKTAERQRDIFRHRCEDLVRALETISRDGYKYNTWWTSKVADEAIAKAQEG